MNNVAVAFLSNSIDTDFRRTPAHYLLVSASAIIFFTIVAAAADMQKTAVTSPEANTGLCIPCIADIDNEQWNGNGIYICINETVDSTLRVFKKIDTTANPPDTILRKAFQDMGWGRGSAHGTKVASVSAGGRTPLQGKKRSFRSEWSGVAPGALIHSCSGCELGDINNHSYHSYDYYYTNACMNHDRLLSAHTNTSKRNNNTGVFGTGNYGIADSKQVGYFSLINQNKNGIKAGAAECGSHRRADFSSIGPARDGRIGIDIMAPASGVYGKWKVSMASVSIVNSGNVKYQWKFNENNCPPAKPWGQDSYRIYNLNAAGDTLRFITEYEGYLFLNNPVPDSICVVTGILDTLCVNWQISRISGIASDSIWIYLYWRRKQDRYLKYGNPYESLAFRVPVSDTMRTDRIALSGPDVSHNIFGWNGNDSLSTIRFDFKGNSDGLQVADWSGGKGLPSGIIGSDGTSLASAYISGVAALMLQKYRDNVLKNKNNMNIHDNPPWNSTIRAILIHTAVDMVDTIGKNGRNNPEYAAFGASLPTLYGVGPDWATGYGLVNPARALDYIDTSRFIEDRIEDKSKRILKITIPVGVEKMRVTLVWDDPACVKTKRNEAFERKLTNDLDLVLVSPSKKSFFPWILNPDMFLKYAIPEDGIDSCFVDANRKKGVDPWSILKNSANKGKDTLNNVEVADIENPEPGEWEIVICAHSIPTDQSGLKTSRNMQDYSIVSDFPVSAARDTIFY